MAKKMLDVIKDLADDAVGDTLDTVVDAGMEKLDPLLDELLALKDEVAAIRKALAISKGELTRFKNEMAPRLDAIVQAADRIDRVFRFLKRLPIIGKMF